MDDKHKLVALYIRVSSTRQAEQGYSLDGQEVELRKAVELQGKTVFKVYRDEGISGARTDRPGLLELLEDARNGRFGSVMVWKVSRISRNLPYLLQIMEELNKLNIEFFSISEQFDVGTPMGKFLAQMLGGIAQMQRTAWRENSILGSKNRAQNGRPCGGRCLGYTTIIDEGGTRKSSRRVVVPEEAKAVKLIFELYASGKGLKATASFVNNLGYRGKTGKEFSSSTIRDILTNPFYIGKVKHEGKLYDGVHEPIISVEQWNSVQKMLATKSRPRKTIDYGYLLSGILKCPKCGSGMIPTHITYKRKDGSVNIRHYYICLRYLNKGVCSSRVVRAKEADEAVTEFILDFLNRGEVKQKILAKLTGKQEEAVNARGTKERIKKLKMKQENLLNLYEQGKINVEDFLAKSQKCKQEIESLSFTSSKPVQKADTLPVNAVKEALRHFPSIFNSADVDTKKKLIRSLVKAVHVDDSRQVNEVDLKLQPSQSETGAVLKVLINERKNNNEKGK